jgi:2-dehydro-3-deoxyphosphogluconate aldolase/(4S)-4-hydroxy-2-oxoglutarate aldolase
VKKEFVLDRIKSVGIIASIRLRSRENALFVAEALRQGGVPIVEIAMTLAEAPEVIAHLRQFSPDVIVGAGSVLNVDMAKVCLDSGAMFITSDRLHPPLFEYAAKHEVVAFPGALTPSEVIAAWESGCDFVKVVPVAQIGGEAYIRSLHAMFPKIPLIAAGGIDQQTASNYILAGAVALGVGRELIPSEAIRRRQDGRIQELARRFAGFVKSARHGNLPAHEGDFTQYPEGQS